MLDVVTVEVKGETPLLMHNVMMADPLSDVAKEMKKISGKRTKTEADHLELARLEWYGSLYEVDGNPQIPGEMLQKAIVMAARKSRKGKQVESGVMIDGYVPLEFPDKGKPLDWLYESGQYTDRRMVCVQKNRVARTRPKFREWSLKFDIRFDDELVSKAELLDMVDLAGKLCAIGDYRPRFGRFERVN